MSWQDFLGYPIFLKMDLACWPELSLLPCWSRLGGFNGISVRHHLFSLNLPFQAISFLKTVRLENEHLGNVDQYRVTREVPLPYPLETMNRDDDEIEHEMRTKPWNYKT